MQKSVDCGVVPDMFTPAFLDHRLLPSRGDLLDFPIRSAHLRHEQIAGLDPQLPAQLMGVEHESRRCRFDRVHNDSNRAGLPFQYSRCAVVFMEAGIVAWRPCLTLSIVARGSGVQNETLATLLQE
jgi:hypothetical protein